MNLPVSLIKLHTLKPVAMLWLVDATPDRAEMCGIVPKVSTCAVRLSHAVRDSGSQNGFNDSWWALLSRSTSIDRPVA